MILSCVYGKVTVRLIGFYSTFFGNATAVAVRPLPYLPHETLQTSLHARPPPHYSHSTTQPCVNVVVACLILRNSGATIEEIVHTPLPTPCLVPAAWLCLYDVVPDNHVYRGCPYDRMVRQ